MAKQDYIFRYLTIIKKLRRSGEATFEEISSYLVEESQFLDRNASFSLRTFQRDLAEIRELFRIDIQYDFSRKVYYIVEDMQSDMNNRMLESIDTINSLKVVEDIGDYMFFEKRKARGTHHFHGLLHAIKNRIILELRHQRFDCEEPTVRLVHPYALKESKGRWYLFAKDTRDHRLKTFGLDRILGFENTPGRFDYPHDLDINSHFRHCFGVINPDDKTPEMVILSFDPEEGKYIKSYPLHESQEIIADNDQELRILLQIFITYDLVMELLSFGCHIKIVAPESLKNEMAVMQRKGFERNSV